MGCAPGVDICEDQKTFWISREVMISELRRRGLERVRALIDDAERIVLTTHVNADGDAAGSEAALAGWLATRGKRVTIINSTPFPEAYEHLLYDPTQVADYGTAEARTALGEADLFIVLDTGEPKRVGRVFKEFGDRPVGIIDHHRRSEERRVG